MHADPMRIAPSRHPPTSAASARTHVRGGSPGSAALGRHVAFSPCMSCPKPAGQPIIRTLAASSVSASVAKAAMEEGRNELLTQVRSCCSLTELSSLTKGILRLDHGTVSAALHSAAVLRRRQLHEEAKGKKQQPCSLKEGPTKPADDLKALLDLLLPASLLTLKVSSSISVQLYCVASFQTAAHFHRTWGGPDCPLSFGPWQCSAITQGRPGWRLPWHRGASAWDSQRPRQASGSWPSPCGHSPSWGSGHARDG